MELDSRIKEGKRPLTCLDVEQARKFEGKLCLFSSSFVNYKNIREYAKYPQYTGILAIKDKFDNLESEESPYRNGNDGYLYEFILPLEWVKEPEKKYRPYSLAEWIEKHEIGDVIKFRNSHNQEFHIMYSGYIFDTNDDIQDIRTKGQIMFVTSAYSFQELFDNYEICVYGEWQPFGVVDE